MSTGQLAYALGTLSVRFPAVKGPRLSANTPWATAAGWRFAGELTNRYAVILYRLIQRRESRQGRRSYRLLKDALFDIPEGVDRSWRSLIQALDDARLSPARETALFAGTKDAVRQLRHDVKAEFR